jgi:hypothetical protein
MNAVRDMQDAWPFCLSGVKGDWDICTGRLHLFLTTNLCHPVRLKVNYRNNVLDPRCSGHLLCFGDSNGSVVFDIQDNMLYLS